MNQHRHNLFLFFLLISLPFFEYGFDYLFGDKDGHIASFRLSTIIKIIQVIIFSFLALRLYLIKVSYFFVFIFFISILVVFDVKNKILKDRYVNPHLHPHPYVGFTGLPNQFKHNHDGFLGPSINQASAEDYTIAFFGASTGYRGNPSLPTLIQRNLIEKNFNNGNVFISNYSTESSIHNQHLHMVIEFLLDQKIDLIIFYGGWNETAGQTGYARIVPFDHKPGFPSNFFYIHDVPYWKKILIENSPIFHNYKHLIINESYHKRSLLSKDWNDQLIQNYFQTLNKTFNVVKTIKPNISEKCSFIAFYQPFDYKTMENIKEVNEEIVKRTEYIPYLYNVSGALDNIKDPYLDGVHSTDQSRKVMAEVLSDIIINSQTGIVVNKE